jgi:hypothetical protein
MMAAPAVRLVLRKLRRFNMVIPNVAQEYANLLLMSPVQGELRRTVDSLPRLRKASNGCSLTAGYDAATLAEKTGKSESLIYSRLALLHLIPEVAEAFQAERTRAHERDRPDDPAPDRNPRFWGLRQRCPVLGADHFWLADHMFRTTEMLRLRASRETGMIRLPRETFVYRSSKLQ